MGSAFNILVVDGDINYLESLHDEEDSSQKIHPLPICTAEAAADVIKAPDTKLCGAFINTNLVDYGWLKIIQLLHANHTGIPIFLTRNSDLTPESVDPAKIGIQCYLDRPQTFIDLVKLVDPLLIGFDTETAIGQSGGGKAVESDSSEFIKIRSKNFLSGSKSLFDIYVSLSNTKFIKICSAGSPFEEGRVIGYIKKGVQHFYIRRSAQKVYVNYCEHLTSRILDSTAISTEVKTAQTLNLGQMAAELFKDSDLDENQIRFAKSYVSGVQKLIGQMNLGQNKIVKKFLDDVTTYEHGVAVTMVTGIMAKEMGFETTYGADTLGLASLMHDIGFVALPDELKHKDVSQMSPEQTSDYQKHPQLGAAILSKMNGINENVAQGIAHHHVRKNQMGFPTNVTFGKTSTIAQLVGLASEYVHAIENSRSNDSFDIENHMKEFILPGFSLQMAKVFNEHFLLKN